MLVLPCSDTDAAFGNLHSLDRPPPAAKASRDKAANRYIASTNPPINYQLSWLPVRSPGSAAAPAQGEVHWCSLEDVGCCWGSCSPGGVFCTLPSKHLSEQGPALSQAPQAILSSIYLSLSFLPIISHEKKLPFFNMSKNMIIIHWRTVKREMCFKHLDKCTCACK